MKNNYHQGKKLLHYLVNRVEELENVCQYQQVYSESEHYIFKLKNYIKNFDVLFY